jgi:hypothetical protein
MQVNFGEEVSSLLERFRDKKNPMSLEDVMFEK